MKTLLLTLLLLASLALASPGIAQPSAGDLERAEADYESAIEAFRAAEYGRAADLFRSSYELVPQPELLYNEAVARARSGDLEGARRVSVEALALELPPPVNARLQARQDGWRVAATSEAMTRSPAPDPSTTVTMGVQTSDSEMVVLPQASSAPQRSPRAVRILSYIAAGLGGAGFVTSGIMEWQLQRIAPELTNAASRKDVQAYRASLKSARAYQTAGRASLAAGSVLLATGIVLWLLSRSEEPEPAVVYRF